MDRNESINNKYKKTGGFGQTCRDIVLFCILLLQFSQLYLGFLPRITCHAKPIYLKSTDLTNGKDTAVCSFSVYNGAYTILTDCFKIDSITFHDDSKRCLVWDESLDKVFLTHPKIPYPIMTNEYNRLDVNLPLIFYFMYDANSIKCNFRNNSHIATIHVSFQYLHTFFKKKDGFSIPIHIQYDEHKPPLNLNP